jgi:hypothetical protein
MLEDIMNDRLLFFSLIDRLINFMISIFKVQTILIEKNRSVIID